MKVFDILREALDIKQLPDGDWAVVDTDTGRPASNVRYPSAGAAETARDNLRVRPTSATRDAAVRATRDVPASTGNMSDINPGPRPGTPTQDQLTRSQQRKLSRHGRVKIRGITYTGQQIAQATRLANQPTPRLQGDTRPDTPDTSTDPKAPTKRGLLKKIMDAWRASSRVGVGAFLNVVLTAVEVEETFDRMVRIWVDEVEKMQKAGETVRLNDEMNAAYFKAVEEIVELSVKGLATVPAAAIAGVLGFVIGTGPAGWIGLMIAGGLIGYYGVEGLYKLLDRAGIIDKIENWVATDLISKEEMLQWAARVDIIQQGDPTGIISDDPFTIPGMGESKIFEETDKEIASKLRDIISNDPELAKMYRDGKEKLKDED